MLICVILGLVARTALDNIHISVILGLGGKGKQQRHLFIDIGCKISLLKGSSIMEQLTSSGKYTVKETGLMMDYSFEYPVFDSIDDAMELLGEAKCLALVQRMVKVDANNTSREKAKTANGHSTRVVMTEEVKAEKKAERASNKKLLEALKSNPELLAQLQG